MFIKQTGFIFDGSTVQRFSLNLHSCSFPRCVNEGTAILHGQSKRGRRQIGGYRSRRRRRRGTRADSLQCGGLDGTEGHWIIWSLIEYFLHLMSLTPQRWSLPSWALSLRLQTAGRAEIARRQADIPGPERAFEAKLKKRLNKQMYVFVLLEVKRLKAAGTRTIDGVDSLWRPYVLALLGPGV